MTDVSAKRHLAKTITWRIVGTLDTFLLGWLITSDWKAGLSIGGAELLTKMILYYTHERIWYKVMFFKGRSKLRHILKTITWRFVGTIDTVLLSWLITERADFGLAIGGLELITKMILYYFHERIWYRSKFGLPPEN